MAGILFYPLSLQEQVDDASGIPSYTESRLQWVYDVAGISFYPFDRLEQVYDRGDIGTGGSGRIRGSARLTSMVYHASLQDMTRDTCVLAGSDRRSVRS